MDIKYYENYMKEILDKTSEYGFEEAEVKYTNSTSMSLAILDGEVSSYENSVEQGISFRGKKNGQIGRAATSVFDENTIDFLLKNAAESTELLNDEDEGFFYADKEHPVLTNIELSGAYDKNTYNKFKEIGLAIESKIKSLSPLVSAVDDISLSCSMGPTVIMNTKGLHTYQDADYVSVIAAARCEDKGIVKSGENYWAGKDIDDFDVDAFSKELTDKMLPKLEARSIPSGTYNIVLGNEAMISLFAGFLSSFSAYEMSKGLSMLKDKEGSKIASDIFTVTEDPLYEKALFHFPFDDEGVITAKKDIIENGVFKTALYNLKTANMSGRESTGNGFNASTGASNLIVKPGEYDLEGLFGIVKDGVYITDISGLHAGLNPITGDFSLLAEGYLIKDSKKGRAVEQITVADNFFEVLKKINAVGNDMKRLPECEGELISPSVAIKDIAIAGEA